MTAKWQQIWRDEKVFIAQINLDKPKYYCFEFPPFPSGSLHMGHVRNYVIGDTTARFKRLMGHNVLYVQGFDSLGLPVEDAALKTNKTPKEWVDDCISKMTNELLKLGLSYDYTKFISYHDPEYYRWTQWIFLKLYEAGMIYRAETWIEWCDTCKTAVAAELIEDGCCWRCGSAPNGKKLFQWFINIKEIAPELLSGLKKIVFFPESAKCIQQNWIGHKEGVYVTIPIEGISEKLEVFTSKIELLYGATFLAIAPENTILPDIIKGISNEAGLLKDIRSMCMIPRIERLKTSQDKGIFINRFGIHPLTGNKIPIFVTPFVVNEFGTGVVYGCPGHVKTDFSFAKAMNLPIIHVIAPQDPDFAFQNEPYLGEGILINSGCYNGLESIEAAKPIADDLIEKGYARKGVSFSIKDWCISRQRYWSAPIPIIHCNNCGIVPVRESELPVELPTEGIDLRSSGNLLEHHVEFLNCKCPDCGSAACRETSTLDTFMNNPWAYLRYCNTDYKEAMFDREAVDYWMPCDIGIGGTEQVTVGNFYYRVILNMLKKIGVTKNGEPWEKSLFHGLVMKDGRKMSKSLGNVVEPARLIERFGVDAVRFHTLSMASPESDVNWSEENMEDSYRFLSKVWDMSNEIYLATGSFQDVEADRIIPSTHIQQVFSHHIQVAMEKIAKNYEEFQFQRVCLNLTIFAEKIERFWRRTCNNMMQVNKGLLHKSLKKLFIMMNPVAPHITEELWEQFGNSKMIATSQGLLNKEVINLEGTVPDLWTDVGAGIIPALVESGLSPTKEGGDDWQEKKARVIRQPQRRKNEELRIKN